MHSHSAVDTCNLALARIGVSKEIASLTEGSKEAAKCNIFYIHVVREVMRDCNWPFLRRYTTLGLVEEDPNDDWSFAYRYPNHCIKIWRIVSGTRNETREQQVPFTLGNDDQGILVYTDMEDAIAEHTHYFENSSLWPDDFLSAVAWKLAIELARPLGRSKTDRQEAMTAYAYEISLARANSFNEQTHDIEPEPAAIRDRS